MGKFWAAVGSKIGQLSTHCALLKSLLLLTLEEPEHPVFHTEIIVAKFPPPPLFQFFSR